MNRLLKSSVTTPRKCQERRNIQRELGMDVQETVYSMNTVYQSTRLGIGLVP